MANKTDKTDSILDPHITVQLLNENGKAIYEVAGVSSAEFIHDQSSQRRLDIETSEGENISVSLGNTITVLFITKKVAEVKEEAK